MKRQSSAQPKSESDDLCGLPKELVDAIDQLPLLSMLHSVGHPRQLGPALNDPVNKLDYQARQVCHLLRVLAQLGNERALRALRDIGINAADVLASISRGEGADIGSRGAKKGRRMVPGVVTLKGDFSKINDILATQLDALMRDFQPSPEYPISQEELHGKVVFVIDVIEALIWRNDRARRMRTSLAEAENEPNQWPQAIPDPKRILRALAEPIDSSQLESEDEKRLLAAEAAIHDAIRRRMERRLTQIAPAAAAVTCRKVASESLDWPARYSAIGEVRRDQQVAWNDLHLGEGVPFRLYRKGGRPRKIDSDSPTGFALDYCLELYKSRARLRCDPGQMAELAATVRNGEGSKILPWDDRDYTPMESLILRDAYEHALRRARWELAAAELPDFPQSKDTLNSSSVLAAWHHAAMFLAEYECSAKWNRYDRWPACVAKRAGENARDRSFKEAVSFCLDRGIQNLQH